MAEGDNVYRQSSSEGDQIDELPGQLLKQLCQPCSENGKETTAAVFCSTCNEFQCKECSNGHNIYTFMQNHKLVDTNVPFEAPVVHNMDGLDRCENHDKMVEYFCKDDEKLCCSTCAIIEHRECNNVDEIKNLNIKKNNGDLALTVEINEIKERTTSALKHWTDGEKRMQGQFQNVLGRLTSVRSSMNKKLGNLEETIQQQASSVFETKVTEYGYNRSKYEDIVNILDRDLDRLDNVRRHGTPEQQFIMQQRVDEALIKTSENTSAEMSKLECFGFCLELNKTLEKLLNSTEKLCSLKTSTSKMTIDSIVEGRPVKLRNIMSVHLQQKEGDKWEPLYSGIDFLPDGRLVAVDNTNDKCIILSERFEQLGSCKLVGKPLDVVTISDDEIAITCREKIIFYQVGNCNEITYSRLVTTTSIYDSFCMKDDDQFVVGVYDDDKPVCIVSLYGEEEDFDIDFPAKKYAVGECTCTYIKNSDKVVLTDRDEHTVYIYNVEDNSSVVVKADQIREPRGVAIGPFDIIFVCSTGTNSVVQISETGQVLSSHKLVVKCPYRVCISEDKTKLALTNCANGENKLQLFCIDV